MADSPSPSERQGVRPTVSSRPDLLRLLMSYLFPASLRCQASSVAGVTANNPGPGPARYKPCQTGEPHPVGGFVTHPVGVAAKHRVLAGAPSNSASLARSQRNTRTARLSIWRTGAVSDCVCPVASVIPAAGPARAARRCPQRAHEPPESRLSRKRCPAQPQRWSIAVVRTTAMGHRRGSGPGAAGPRTAGSWNWRPPGRASTGRMSSTGPAGRELRATCANLI
jgi:hypothetical protein